MIGDLERMLTLSRVRFLATLIVVAGALLHNPAYGASLADTGSIVFSPDGALLAYVWVERLELPVSIEVPKVSQRVYVRWCGIERTKDQNSVEIDSFGPERIGYTIESFLQLKFSPDSQHLAVLSPHFLTVVDLKSGEHWRLTGQAETVTSLAWLGNVDVAYAAHSNIGGEYKQIADRTFWRQNIHASQDKRVLVYAEKGLDTGISTWVGGWAPLENWSPGGRFVIFMSPSTRGRFQLLDIKGGTSTEFGQSKAFSQGVSWKPDESAAVCVSQVVGMRKPYEALLISPGTGETYDFSREFVELFGEFPPRLEAIWPADTDHFIANDTKLGGCLVRPRPWDVVQVGNEVRKHVTVTEDRAPWIYPLPQVGWVRALVGKGDALQATGWVAVDYLGKRFVTIPGGPAWSRDGSRNASVAYDGSITIQEVDRRSLQLPH